ncbi:protein PAT1 homolog 2 isoform X1 [Brienomyrus brachyistius]|uniref:protein PAT1 homolog 2 isoform X1 n=1 Tax=Brienomyrus brachyistius TaxID=42636 RepID=UPI0020B1A1FF|nr:protein PAT1 homolog 2 isoform X1 [Brienomyrus brachyistius]
MSDSEQQQESEAFSPTTRCQGDRESGSEAEDDGGMEECTLLQEMGEEDEDIDLYNEETFGLDLEVRPDEDPSDILVFCGDESPGPPSPPPCTPNTPAPLTQVLPVLNGRPREKRTLRRGEVFEDPAIMRTVKSRPSLKSLDSAIVDSGIGSPCDSLDLDTWMLSPFGPSQTSVGPMLQDQAIVTVIDSQDLARTPPAPLDFLSPLRRPFPMTGGGKRGGQRGQQPLMRPLGQRYLSQIPMSPLLTRSPVCPRPPFGSPQHYMQRGGFMSPSQPGMTVPQPFTPKMLQLRFGARSPSPSPFYSPSANPMQQFRFPGHVTQLHPQHRRLLSHRHQRSHRGENLDPNGQLMSMKEKEWIIKLQMIQLQSENPHLDDYYYQEYYRRLEAKMAEEEMLGERGKREPPKLTTPYVTKTESYTPVVHIEGSLGQVAVSTCFSPRRAIDAVHAHLPEESHFSEQEQKDARQQRLTVLHNIEKLFMVLLEVEEGEKRKRSMFSEEEQVRLEEKISRRVKQIYRQLQHPPNLEDSEEFLPCLLVSKGKRLMARLLPFLSESDAQHVLKVVTDHLPALMNRDTDEALPVMYPSLSTVIGELSFNQLIGVLKGFTSTLPDSKEMCLTIACQNKFGISLLYALLSQGERLLSSNSPMEAGIGDYETWTETVFLVARRLSRSSLVEPLLLPSNLISLFCRYLDKHTVHQLEDSMERSTASCPAVPS